MDFSLSKMFGVGGRFVFEMRKIFLGDERRAMLLIPRARVITQRVLDDMARNGIVQGQAIERDAEGSWIKVTAIVAPGLQRMVTAEMYVAPVVRKLKEVSQSALFFFRDVGNNYVVTLRNGNWNVIEQPDFVEYPKPEDTHWMTSNVIMWAGDGEDDIVVVDGGRGRVYGRNGIYLGTVVGAIEADKYVVGCCRFDGIPIVVLEDDVTSVIETVEIYSTDPDDNVISTFTSEAPSGFTFNQKGDSGASYIRSDNSGVYLNVSGNSSNIAVTELLIASDSSSSTNYKDLDSGGVHTGGTTYKDNIICESEASGVAPPHDCSVYGGETRISTFAAGVLGYRTTRNLGNISGVGFYKNDVLITYLESTNVITDKIERDLITYNVDITATCTSKISVSFDTGDTQVKEYKFETERLDFVGGSVLCPQTEYNIANITNGQFFETFTHDIVHSASTPTWLFCIVVYTLISDNETTTRSCKETKHYRTKSYGINSIDYRAGAVLWGRAVKDETTTDSVYYCNALNPSPDWVRESVLLYIDGTVVYTLPGTKYKFADVAYTSDQAVLMYCTSVEDGEDDLMLAYYAGVVTDITAQVTNITETTSLCALRGIV